MERVYESSAEKNRGRVVVLMKNCEKQMVNFHGGEVENSSVNEENDERVGDDGSEGEGEEDEDEDDDSENNYDPQSVTVPLTLCFAIMVG